MFPIFKDFHILKTHKDDTPRINLILNRPENLIVFIGAMMVAIVVFFGASNFGTQNSTKTVASATPANVYDYSVADNQTTSTKADSAQNIIFSVRQSHTPSEINVGFSSPHPSSNHKEKIRDDL